MLLSVTPDADKQCAVIIGSNDLWGAYNPEDPTKQRLTSYDSIKEKVFKASLFQIVVNLLIERKATALNIGYEGIWDDTNVKTPYAANLNLGKKSNVKGAMATAHTSGTAVYIGYIIERNGNATADVLIDGIKVGSLSSSGDTSNDTIWGPGTARFGGLSPGQHTIEVIMTSSNGDSFLISYIAGSDHSAAPKILLSNIIPMSEPAYIMSYSSKQTVTRYNKIIADLISELTADGFDIRPVDNHSSIDPTTDLTADGIHPNDAGHRKIYETFRAARFT